MSAPRVPWLPDVVEAQKNGQARGVYSICSANPFVLEASMLQAKADGSAVCIESTSNQVNPEGGYTGQTPADFVAFVRGVARDADFPFERILLGGDHLGPFPWQDKPAGAAMDKARATVRDYVLAGYAKIHLDASMRCGDDPKGALASTTVTERAADLCAVAEDAAARRGSVPLPLYVIGTEVPVPGGEQEAVAELTATTVADAEQTLALTRSAFARRGLEGAWERVAGLVVQPGVEFGDTTVFDYERSRTVALKRFIVGTPGIVFEAHSTDYQTEGALRQLVEDHFAILKVGPALTFALREAVFALADVEQQWLGRRKGVVVSDLRGVIEAVMLEKPGHWQRYYHGDADALRVARSYSLSDRIRYYWTQPPVAEALTRLLANLTEHPAPSSLLTQYVPKRYGTVRRSQVPADPRSIIRSKILEVTEAYARACGTRPAA